MKGIRYVAVLAMASFIMGCPARSLFPLFTEAELVYEPRLVGTWGDKEGGDTFTFQKSGEKGYGLLLRDKNGDTTLYKAQLGRLGEFWFLDSFPAKSSDDYHLISSHMISKIHIANDSLRMSFLEGDWLRDMIEKKKLNISHVSLDNDIVLTATTKELQSLALRYAEDDAAFPDPGVLVRQR